MYSNMNTALLLEDESTIEIKYKTPKKPKTQFLK